MFSYYGSKSKISHLYPPPIFDTIVEPFAGAAFYSMRYLNSHRIILNDLNPTVYGIWKWLKEEATEEVILANRNFFLGQNISELDLHPAHKDLIGFCINRGCSSPANVVQKWSCQSKSNPQWASTPFSRLTKIASELPKLKKIEVSNLSFQELSNIKATWFIDPPYQFGGRYYKFNQIDYDELKKWVLNLNGQVIVCENSQSQWLPSYQRLTEITGQKRKSEEVVFLRGSHEQLDGQ